MSPMLSYCSRADLKQDYYPIVKFPLCLLGIFSCLVGVVQVSITIVGLPYTQREIRNKKLQKKATHVIMIT